MFSHSPHHPEIKKREKIKKKQKKKHFICYTAQGVIRHKHNYIVPVEQLQIRVIAFETDNGGGGRRRGRREE